MIRTFFDKLFSQKPNLAIAAGLMTAFALALVPILVRYSQVGPTATGFYRFFLAFPFIITWMIFDNLKDPNPKTPRTRKDYFLMIASGVFLALDLFFWHWSMLETTVVNATLLNNLTSVIVAIISWLFFKEKAGSPLILGIIMALTGSTILVGHSFKAEAGNLFGDFLALISAFFFAAFILTVKNLSSRFRTPTILAWGAIPTIYILGVLAFLSGEVLLPESPEGWAPLFLLAFVVHIGGQGLLTYSMAHISATLSSLLMSLSPLFAAILAWIFFNETLTALQAGGGLIVILGILVARQSRLTFWKKK